MYKSEHFLPFMQQIHSYRYNCDLYLKEFNNYQTSLINKIEQSVNKKSFVTSQDYPEILNQENWKTIRTYCDNLRVWLIYDKGKSIAYIWDKNKLTDKEAKQKAELKLLLM